MISHYMNIHTPLPDQDQKFDIIEHINNDHQAELAAIIADQNISFQTNTAYLDDIVEEGCLVSALDQGNDRKTLFIPFELKGDIEEKFLYLAYMAMVKQGKPLTNTKKRYFEVISAHNVSTNMLRLELKHHEPLSDFSPGFALLFVQKSLEKAPLQNATTTEKVGKLTQWGNNLFLWVMKYISTKQREKILTSMSKGLRYYTIRSSFTHTENQKQYHIALVDIFIHGDTPGNQWAESLQAGNIIASNNQYEEKTNHLKQGHALLIADETGMPALLSIIESWDNPIMPTVIILTTHAQDQQYITGEAVERLDALHRLVGNDPSELLKQATKIIEQQENIDTAWGGLESGTAKAVRSLLRNQHNLTGERNRVKTYWTLNRKN